jgi:uncharacterized protein YidB (DUF937 family)
LEAFLLELKHFFLAFKMMTNMFDQILNLVKEHLQSDPQVAAAIPDDQKKAVHEEIANHITQKLATEAPQQGGIGGLLSKLQNSVASGSPITSAIEGGLAGKLSSKFGLSPTVTGAIAAILPGILQKFANKAKDPNDHSVTEDGIANTLSKFTGGLGNLFK